MPRRSCEAATARGSVATPACRKASARQVFSAARSATIVVVTEASTRFPHVAQFGATSSAEDLAPAPTP